MITIIIISSLICFGLNYCYHYEARWAEGYLPEDNYFGNVEPMRENREILWFVRFYIGNYINYLFPKSYITITKPLFNCVVCMASVYGSATYWINWYFYTNQDFTYLTVLKWLAVVVATAGLNRIIRNLTQM